MRKCAGPPGVPPPPAVLNPTQSWPSESCLAVAGSIYLAVSRQPACESAGASTLLSYLFLYTPLKRKTPLCVLVGAFPGAMPPLIGWAAASGGLNCRGVAALRHPLPVAVSTFHGNRMDVPRRLRPRRLLDSAEGQRESSFRDFRNSVAARCSRRNQPYAISDAPRDDFSLCRGSSGNRIHVLRMEIRVRAFESCRTPSADGLDCLSSTVVRTERDVMQSGQMIQRSHLAPGTAEAWIMYRKRPVRDAFADQPQRLRPDVERCTRDGWHSRR